MSPTESLLSWGRLSGLPGPRGELEPGRTVIVTDPRIRKLHGSDFPPGPVLEVERGEAAKSLGGLEALWAGFLDLGVDRTWTVLSIGGGSVSDLAGFAASTWQRGLDFCAVPTTLLAMVDASVGGKNGIDYRGLKNLLGTFSKPLLVHFDTSLLDSLPDADFASGMAEVIKHGVLEGGEHFSFLEAHPDRAGLSGPALEEVVRRSVAYKTGVTSRDPREAGERRLLNLGHTVGHGIEAVTGLSHGACVAAGLGFALELAASRPGASAQARKRILSLLSAWGLPTSLGEAANMARKLGRDCGDDLAFRKAVATATMADKKKSGNTILFVLPLDLGKVEIEALPLEKLGALILEAP